MNIREFVAGLQAIFDANDPSDGIDRQSGFGSDVRITGLKVIGGDERGDLEVTFELTLSPYWKFKKIPRFGTIRVPFGTQWLAASGVTTPAEYAPDIAREVEFACHSLIEQATDSRSRRRADPAAADRDTAPADELWAQLLVDLGHDHVSARESEAGVIEVIEDGGDGPGEPVWIHLTPEQWRSYVVDCEISARNDSGVDASSAGDGPGLARLYLDETLGSRCEGERHIVLFKDGFHGSIRAELPPVRDPASRTPRTPPDGDWYAFAPER